MTIDPKIYKGFIGQAEELLKKSNQSKRQMMKLLNEYTSFAAEESAEEQEKTVQYMETVRPIFQTMNSLSSNLAKLEAMVNPDMQSLKKEIRTNISMSEKIENKLETTIKKVKAELKYKLIVAEKLGRPFLEINDGDIKKYQEITDQELLNEWLPKGLTAKVMPTNKKPARRGKKTQAPQKSKKEEVVVAKAAVKKESLTPDMRRVQFLQGLLVVNPHCRLKELPRVTARWKEASLEEIREFEDRTEEGEVVKHYEHLTNENIQKQRARHLLPGLDSLLMNDSFKRVYTFPTSKGAAMFATLHYGPRAEKGIVYVGISSGGVIYHKYFEPSTSQSLKGNVTIDPVREKQAVQETGEWIHTIPFDPEIAADGTLTLRFQNELHFIQIEPVRADLLDANIFTIATDS